MTRATSAYSRASLGCRRNCERQTEKNPKVALVQKLPRHGHRHKCGGNGDHTQEEWIIPTTVTKINGDKQEASQADCTDQPGLQKQPQKAVMDRDAHRLDKITKTLPEIWHVHEQSNCRSVLSLPVFERSAFRIKPFHGQKANWRVSPFRFRKTTRLDCDRH